MSRRLVCLVVNIVGVAITYRFRPAWRDYQKAAPIQYFKPHF